MFERFIQRKTVKKLLAIALIFAAFAVNAEEFTEEKNPIEISKNGFFLKANNALVIEPRAELEDGRIVALGRNAGADGYVNIEGQTVAKLEADFTPEQNGKYRAKIGVYPVGIKIKKVFFAFKTPLKFARGNIDIQRNPYPLPEKFVAKFFDTKRLNILQATIASTSLEINGWNDTAEFLKAESKNGTDMLEIRWMFRPEKEGTRFGVNVVLKAEKAGSVMLPLDAVYNTELPIKYFANTNGYVEFGKVRYMIAKDMKCIALKKGESTTVNVPRECAALKNLYILNAFSDPIPDKNAVAAKVEAFYRDGTMHSANIFSKQTGTLDGENLPSTWCAQDETGITKNVYTTKVTFEKARIDNLVISNQSNETMYIWSACMSAFNYTEKQTADYRITPNSEYVKLEYNAMTQKASALDFSFLLDAPAGKYGFAKARLGKYFFENAPDRPVRFFGGNLCESACFPRSQKEAADTAEAVARLGYNVVRIHHYDAFICNMASPDGTDLDPAKLNSFELLLSELKKRGIYVHIDLFVSRVLRPNQVQHGFRYLTHPSAGKAYIMGSKLGLENWKNFSKKLLEHVSPYTNLALKDDPMLLQVCLMNESLLRHYDWVLRDYFWKTRFPQWMEKNDLVLTQDNRKLMVSRFSMEFGFASFLEMQRFLKEDVGIKALVSNMNHTGGAPLILESAPYEVSERHTYFSSPVFMGAEWRLPIKISNKCMVDDFASTLASASLKRIKDKPLAITEWNASSLAPHAGEGGIIGGAYPAMQGVDFITRFQYACQHFYTKNALTIFDSKTDPMASVSDRAAALMLLRGDVAESPYAIPVLVAKTFFEKSSPEKIKHLAESPDIEKHIRLVAPLEHVVCDKISDYSDSSKAPFILVSEREWLSKKFNKPAFYIYDENLLLKIAPLFGAEFMDVDNGVYKSASGELKIDLKKGTFKTVTARTEAFIVPENSSAGGRFVETLETGKSHETLCVSSLDNLPLSECRRIVILKPGLLRNNNMTFTDGNFDVIKSMGWLPLLLKKSAANIVLNRDLTGFNVYALTAEGRRVSKIPFTVKDGKTRIALNSCVDNTAIFAYEITDR